MSVLHCLLFSCRCLKGYLQRFAALRSGGFLAQKFNRRTALEPTTKLSYEELHPPLRKTAVVCCPSVFIVGLLVIYVGFCPALAWWLFCKLRFVCWLCAVCKCATKSVVYCRSKIHFNSSIFFVFLHTLYIE